MLTASEIEYIWSKDIKIKPKTKNKPYIEAMKHRKEQLAKAKESWEAVKKRDNRIHQTPKVIQDGK